MRNIWLLTLALGLFGPLILAQSPPGLLPSSVTGRAAPTAVTPAGGAIPKQPPIARFQDLRQFSPETVATVMSLRSSAEWLAKRQQPHGRFLYGVNPALRTPLEGDSELKQATAAWALAQAASFTGEERLAAAAGQAVLSLLTFTADDPMNPAVKTITGDAKMGTDVAFAATLVLAIQSLGTTDAKLASESQKLCNFLRAKIQADGSINCGAAASTESQLVYPGLVLQALVLGRRQRLELAEDALLQTCFAHYRAKFKSQPHSLLAGSLIPAASDFVLQAKDANVAAGVFEMADWLCTVQHGKGEVKQLLWAGGFPTATTTQPSEPTHESAIPARALASACQMIHYAVPDLTRHQKYRAALIESHSFLRGLQYTNENADHFLELFRRTYLLGGTRTSLTDGNIRIDATGLSLLAFQKYLESGAE